MFDMNIIQFFLQKVEMKFPNDRGLLNRMSIIEEAQPQQIRMAHLAVVGSHKVNGVAALHSNLIKTTVRSDFLFAVRVCEVQRFNRYIVSCFLP